MIKIINVSIVDIRDGEIRPNMEILVRDDRILKISKEISFNEKIIDGCGGWVIPGLIDMHVHLGSSKNDLDLYLKKGVTTIRNMAGIEGFSILRYLAGTRTFNHLKLKRKIERGEILGPRIITSGHPIEGENSLFPSFIMKRFVTEEKAVKEVKRQKIKGYDFIKIYSGISKDIFYEVIKAAKELGLKVCGHTPFDLSVEEISRAGISCIEHIHGLVYPFRPNLNPSSHSYNRIFDTLKRNSTWICPTLIAYKRTGDEKGEKDYMNEEDFVAIEKRVQKSSKTLNRAFIKSLKKKELKPHCYYYDDIKKAVKSLNDRGVGILAGTDTGIPYISPGFALIKEISLLHDAGLSRLEALQCATYNPAKYLCLLNSLGTIEEGKKADIVILKENPLKDLKSLNNPFVVISNGKVVNL